jgi:hypothetical protein
MAGSPFASFLVALRQLRRTALGRVSPIRRTTLIVSRQSSIAVRLSMQVRRRDRTPLSTAASPVSSSHRPIVSQ